MIFVKLMGGLGNQMFQYAAARRIAYKHKVKVKMDLAYLLAEPPDHTVIKRDYELGIFALEEHFASPEEIQSTFHKSYGKLVDKLRGKFLPTWSVKEDGFPYHSFLKEAPARTYLDGFWQTENYFKDVEHVIRKDFTFKLGPDKKNKEVLEQIKKMAHPVSLHVRRGDYISNPFTNSYHGVCGLDYYQRAIQHVADNIPGPHFFLFSDDPQWVKDNLVLDFPFTIVDHNQGKKNYEDLRLMSACQHHIIANSSFSWWGAWLNPSPSKIVIAPKKWFNLDQNTQDLVPATWIKL